MHQIMLMSYMFVFVSDSGHTYTIFWHRMDGWIFS